MPDQTVRYRAATRYSYALALRDLAAYARQHGEDFEVYPADLAAMEHQGLAVTGPDLDGVRGVLDKVPGLAGEET